MNSGHHKTIFSKRLGCMVAVGEHASSQGKANGASSGQFSGSAGTDWLSTVFQFVGVLTASCALVTLAWAGPVATNAVPTGGQVAQGAASISQSGAVMNITQSTPKAVVNWNTFDIGQNAKVNIVQPGADAVMLNRVTSANPSQILGQLNANGQVVLVNPNGVLFGKDGSVNANSFTASTLGISDANFMAGNNQFERNGSTAAVVNQGSIKTTGGYVALLGASVSNEGQIQTQGGTAYLAAAETVKIPVSGSGRIKLELSPSRINAAVANGKTGTIVTEGGQVYMQAASLSTMVASIIQSGSIDTTGEQGGAVHLLADGGQIKVDGGIIANSNNGSAGGDIYIGRDKDTNVLAAVGDASGAKLESKGGFVETSGEFLKVDGIQVKAKEWLLDPNDIVIGSTATTGGSLTNAQAANSVSQILASDVSNALTAGTNVIIATTASATGGNGDITVSAAVSNTAAGNTLTLNAGRNVVLNNSITASNISLNAAIGSVSGAGALTTTGMLTLNSATAGTLSGSIAGTGGLTKTGAGITTLAGASTYTGSTAVNAGKLVNTNMGNFKTSSIAIAAGATFEANVASNTYYSGSTSVSGAGTFQKTGAGGLSLSSGSTIGLKFENNAGGKIDIQNGALQNNWLKGALNANLADVNIESGALLDIRGEAVQMRGLSGSGNVINTWSNTNILTIGAGATTSNSFSYNGIIGAAVGNVSILPSPSPSTGGTLTDTSPTLVINLIKAGTGTQVLTNNNIYTGTTTIRDGGTLQIGDGNGTGTIGTGNVILANGSNLSYQRNVNTTIDNVISGTGNVTSNITGGGLTVSKAINLTKGNILLDNTGGSFNSSGVFVPGTGNTVTTTRGVYVNAAIATNDGDINIAATSKFKGFENSSIGTITAKGKLNIAATMSTAGGYQGANIAGNLTGASVSLIGNSNGHHGVDVAAAVTVKSTSGDVYLEGNASNTAAAVGLNASSGAQVLGKVDASGNATIKGTTSDAGLYQGLIISNVVKGSSVELIGSSVKNLGVELKNTGLITSTNGSVTITGISGTSDAVRLGVTNTLSNTTAITATGDVNITGTAGNSSLTQSGTTGVHLYDGVTITAGNSASTPATSGSINITGTVDTQTGKSGNGVDFQRYPTAARLTATGDISINGTVTGSGNGSGVILNAGSGGFSGQAPMMKADGKFTLRGNNRSSANSSVAISGASGVQVTAGSDIVIQAETNNATQNAINFSSSSNQQGNASFKSSSGNVLIQANQGAINFSNALPTNTLAGPTYTSSTDIRGKNITIDNTGAGMAIGAGTTMGSGGTLGGSIAIGSGISLTGVITKGSGYSSYASGGAITFNSSAGLAITASENVNIAAVNNGASQSGLYTSSASAISGKNVTIDGSSLNTNGVINYGTITATGGDVNIAGASVNGSALSLQGVITGSQNVAITGSNTIASNGAAVAYINRVVTATNGKIDITTSTLGTTANALQLASDGSLSAKTAVNIKTDTLDINTSGAFITATSIGTVTIKTDTAAAKIDIGNGTGTSGVDSGVGSRTLGLKNAELNRITAGNLIIGDASNTGGITVSAAITTTGNVTLQTGGNIAVNAALTVVDAGATRNLTLNGAGATSAISQTAAIKAAGLELLGTNATHTLTNTDNQVTTLAASTKAIDYFNSGALTLGSVNTEGINASGDVSIATGIGNLTIAKSIVSTATSATALKLNAAKSAAVGAAVGLDDSGNIIIVSGGTVSMGTGGTAHFMTGSITGDTTAAGLASSGNFRYNSDETNANYSTALSVKNSANNGINVIYREAPSLTVKVNNASKTYDRLTYSGGNGFEELSTSSLKNSDTLTSATASAVFGGTAQGAKNASITPYTLSASESTSGTSALGYLVNYNSGTLTVTKASLTKLEGGKTYDGQNASVTSDTSSGALTITGVNGETATLKAAESLALTSANAGDTTVTAAGISSLSNSKLTADGTVDLSNYDLSQAPVTTNKVKIAQAKLIAITAEKTYDGKNTVDAVQVKTIAGVNGETFTAASGTAKITSKDVFVANNQITDIANLQLGSVSGSLTNNYDLSSAALPSAGVNTNNVVIGKLAISASIDSVTTIYGNNAATGGVNLIGVIGVDQVSPSGSALTGGVFSSSNNLKAGTYVQSVGGGLTGTDAGNYTFSGTSSNNYVVNKLALNTQIAGVTTTYGTAAATGAASVSGVLSGDKVDLGNAKATLVNAVNSSSGNLKAGTYQQTVANSLNGDDAANYTAAPTSLANYVVTPKAISATVTAADKVYDGNNVATLNANSAGILTGDVVNVLGATGTFASKNVARDGSGNAVAQAVTVSGTGVGLGGTDGANYTLTNAASIASTTAKITPKDLKASIAAVQTTYGQAAETGKVTLSGVLVGDAVQASSATLSGKSLSGSGQLKAGTYTQTVGSNLSGADAVNYNTVGINSQNYVVNKLALTTNIADVTTVYGTSAKTGIATLQGVLAGDAVNLPEATLVSTALSSSGQLKAGTYQQTVGNSLSGADADNYTTTPTTQQNYVVTPKAIAVVVTAADKVYDGNNVATLTANSADILAGDVVNVQGAIGTFANKNVVRDGSGNAVTQTVTVSGAGVGLGGTDGTNYTVTNANSIPSTTAKITPKDLTTSGITANDKVYDGSTTAVIKSANAVLAGLVAGDSVSVSSQTANSNFADKNVAFDGAGAVASQAVTVSGLSLNGADAANYNVSDKSGAAAKVLQRALSITGSVAQDKTVDGNTNAQVTPGQLGNLVAGESLVVSATGQFADAEIGTNKAVATQYALANGANGTARNYTLAGEVLRAAILVAAINPVQPIVNPAKTGGGSRVAVSGSGNSGAALGVAESSVEEEVISREECSVLNPEKCQCQESTIAGVEMCFAPVQAANSKN